MTSNLKRVGAMLILALMMSLSAISFTQINSNAIGDVSVKVDGKGGLTVGGDLNQGNSANSWNNFLDKYKGFIVGVSGIGAITMIGVLIFNFIKLCTSSTNPGERTKVLQGLVWSAIAAAGLGAVAIIVGFFYGMLK